MRGMFIYQIATMDDLDDMTLMMTVIVMIE